MAAGCRQWVSSSLRVALLSLLVAVVGLALLLGPIAALLLQNVSRHYPYTTTPEREGLSRYNEVVVPSFDHSRNRSISLAGLFFPQQQANGPCVLCVHGHGANMLRVYGSPEDPEKSILTKAVAPLYAAGFTVLAIDLRNHGNSDDGMPVTLGVQESHDVAAGVRWLANQSVCDPNRLGLWGESMGGATVLVAAAGPARGQVSAVASEAAFVSFRSVIGSWLRDKLPVPDFLVKYLIWWCEALAAPGVAHLNVADVARTIPPSTALFIAHGKADSLVEYQHGVTIYDAAKRRSNRCWSESGVPLSTNTCAAAEAEFFSHSGGHVRAYQHPQYHTRLISFFKRHL